MWTMTTVTRRTPTCARSEHACTLFRLSRHSHWYITFPLGSKSLESVIPSSRYAHVRLSLSCSTSLFTSPCFSPYSSRPSSPCTPTTLTPWQTTCAASPTGPSSPWTISPSHRWWAQRHGAHRRHGAQRLGPQQDHWLPGFPRPLCPVVRPRRGWRDTRQATRRSTPRLRRSKYLLHASMITTSKKKKQNLLENCYKYAFQMFSYV